MTIPTSHLNTDLKLNQQAKLNIIVAISLGLVLLFFNAIELFYELTITLVWVTVLFYTLIHPINILHNGFRKLIPTVLKNKLKSWAWVNISLLKTAGRIVSIALVMGIFLTIVGILTSLSVKVINSRIDDFSKDIPVSIEKISNKLKEISNQPQDTSNQIISTWVQKAQEISTKLSERSHEATALFNSKTSLPTISVSEDLNVQTIAFLRRNAFSSLQYLYNFGTQSINTLIFSLTGIVLLFYFLLDGDHLSRGFIKLLPKTIRDSGKTILKDTHILCVQHFNSQIGFSLIITLMALLLNLGFGVKYPIILALFLGIASLIPALGIWIGIVPTAIVLYTTHHEMSLLMLSLGLVIFYSFKYKIVLKRYPDILPLHPITVVFSLFISLPLIGISALAFTIPLSAFLTVVLHWLISKNQQHKLTTL